MAIAIVQDLRVTSSNGFGTTHDIGPFLGAVTPGNKILCQHLGDEDVTGATVNGMTGPPSAELDATEVLAIKTGRAFRYNSPDASATGFRFATSTPHFAIAARILEVSGMDDDPFVGSGQFIDFQGTELDATADSEDGGAAFSLFADVPLANITAQRSGYTQSGQSADTELLQHNLNTGSGTTTAGATLSSNDFFTEGVVFTYKASSAPTFQAAWARNANQVIA